MENLRFNLGVPGRDPSKSKPRMSLEKAIARIKGKKYPASIEAGLIASLKTCPQNTYDKFLLNIHTHLRRLQNAKKEKLEKENNDGNKGNDTQAEEKGESNVGNDNISGDELLDS